MNRLSKALKTTIAAGAIALIAGASADAAAPNGIYVQNNLVSNGFTTAVSADPNLSNPWGVGFFPGGPIWIADNNTGLSTLYDGLGDIISLVVNIPNPSGSNPTGGTPTGVVAQTNPTLFIIPGTTDPAEFIFDTEDGTILAWNSMVNVTAAQVVIDNSQGGGPNGAVYKGIALGNNATGEFLYAANFRSGKIDVFDSTFKPATLSGAFADPKLPPGVAPFNIANINGNLFVTYAKQNVAKSDPTPGLGLGAVDVFDTNGNLIENFANNGKLNAPWGVTQAPLNFGRFSGDILIGNFGDGHISAFNPQTRAFLGQLVSAPKTPVTISGLWALSFGGFANADPGVLYFTAGPHGYADGLYGSLTPQ